jgi:hypothetical protein
MSVKEFVEVQEKEAPKKVVIPINDSESGNDQKIVDDCKKYCKQEWIGMNPVIKAVLISLGALNEDEELPKEIVKLAKQVHYENKLHAMQKSKDDGEEFAY